MIPSLFAVVLFLFIFGGVPGFRDGAHFYAPLFQYLFDEFSQGRIPLWNPYDNYGQPLAANPTTAAFYPVMWAAFCVHYLFGVDTLSVYAGYCGFHLLLAMVTMYRLARRFGCSPDGSTVAALSYALGGQVLFQWNNVPFLVGAAWLPEAVNQWNSRERKMINYLFSVCIALMILGGDPQAAYNAVLIAAVFWINAVRMNKEQWTMSNSLLSILSALLLAFLLAAVQILPAWELGLLSDRTLPEHQQWIANLYSIHPLRLIEFFFPNAGGVQFPVHARWFNALNENGIWVPSLYIGLLPAYWAVYALFPFKNTSVAQSKTAKFSLVSSPYQFLLFLVFLLASLGGWCFVYQFFNCLPGYAMFRYPAKLMTVAVMFFAVFAAKGFDLKSESREQKMDSGKTQAVPQPSWSVQRLRSLMLRFPFSILYFCCALCMILWTYCTKISTVPPCPVFGPFDAGKAANGLLFSFGTAAAVLLLYNGLRQPDLSRRLSPRWKNQGIILLVFLDLALSNGWMLAPSHGPFSAVHSPLPAVHSPFVRRYPDEFLTVSSPNRLTEIIDWEQRYGYPRYNLPLRKRIHGVKGTLVLKSYAEFNEQSEGTSIYQNQLSISNYQFPNPNRCEFTVELEQDTRVVIPEQYYPGWQVFAENEHCPLSAVNSSPFLCVDLPAGKHHVTMIYDPPLFKFGAALSILGVLCVVLIFITDCKRNL